MFLSLIMPILDLSNLLEEILFLSHPILFNDFVFSLREMEIIPPNGGKWIIIFVKTMGMKNSFGHIILWWPLENF